MGAYVTHKIVWVPHNFGVEPHGGFESDKACEVVVAFDQKLALPIAGAKYCNVCISCKGAGLGNSARQGFREWDLLRSALGIWLRKHSAGSRSFNLLWFERHGDSPASTDESAVP